MDAEQIIQVIRTLLDDVKAAEQHDLTTYQMQPDPVARHRSLVSMEAYASMRTILVRLLHEIGEQE